ncbi:hypothetical protein V6N13_129449 [Hibiscus sabdariffa]
MITIINKNYNYKKLKARLLLFHGDGPPNFKGVPHKQVVSELIREKVCSFFFCSTAEAKAFLIFETIYQVEILCSFSCKIQFLDGVEGESN